MNIIKTNISGVLIIEPSLFRDACGYFFESFSERGFDENVTLILGHKVHFCQDNESMSSYGVMRGLHFQRPPFTQSKLVRCVKGRVLDVAVDIRKGSPLTASMWQWNRPRTTIASSLSQEALPMVSPCSQRQPYSNTSVMSSITQRQMEASISWMIPLALIGKYQPSTPTSQRRIRSMRC